MLRGDRNSVAVVLNEKQERQLFRGDDIECGPEAVRGSRSVAAMRDSDAVPAFLVAEIEPAIAQSLGPTHRGGVLSADAAATRQHASAFFPRHVEHHADVPALAHAPDSHHGRGKGLLE